MKTYRTRQDAEQDRQAGAQHIAEIDHATEGRVYIQIKCDVDTLRTMLARKPMPEIINVIDQYDYPKTAREQRAELVRNLNSLIEQDHDDHEARINQAVSTGIAPAYNDYTDQIAAARTALAKYDAEHPEVIEQIKAEQQANIDAHLWD